MEHLMLLTVLSKDRSGIIAKVTGVIYRTGANLEDATMTILEGELSMMLVICLDSAQKKKIDREFNRLSGSGLTFFWKEMKGKRARGESHQKNSHSCIITAIGKDQTGIVFKISQVLAGFKLNITDLNSRILGQGKKAVYALALEFDLPKKFKLSKLERGLKDLNRSLKIELNLKPVERIEF